MKNLNDCLQKLASEGLNIFGSCLVANLPPEIQNDLTKAGIPIADFKSLSILAHGGRTLWTRIPQPANAEQHPINNHTLRLLENFGAPPLILFPNEKWLIPLQRLGRFLNLARPSLLGLDLNSEYGPWFAYRAVFLTKIALPETQKKEWDSPCNTCEDKPCIAACPSGATAEVPFGLNLCATYRLNENSECLSRCLARMACPYKSEHRYAEEQMNYHMLRPLHLRKLAGYK